MLLSLVTLRSAVLILAAVLTTPPEALLRRSDVAALAPSSFRARLTLTSDAAAPGREIEIWRSGEGRTLIRFLGPKEKGKYLLRLEDDLWLLAPGARKPVRLDRSHRVYGGVRIDEILGIRLAEHYDIESATPQSEAGGERVVFELRARTEGLMFPRVRWVVDPASGRPVRADYRLPSGRQATSVEFLDWSDGEPFHASRLVVRDLLRGGRSTEITIVEMDALAVPDALFDLDDSTARKALERAEDPNATP